MKFFFGHRVLLALAATALLTPLFTAALAQGIAVTPNVVEIGTSPRVTITASGFFDLSEVGPSQIGIRPSEGVSDIRIINQTAQRLSLSFGLAEDTPVGTRTLFIKNNSGVTVVALDLNFKLGPSICRPPCEAPSRCSNNVCVRPPPPPPPPVCNPPCRAPRVCEFGRCVLLK